MDAIAFIGFIIKIKITSGLWQLLSLFYLIYIFKLSKLLNNFTN